jgi:hypothetical protein
MKACPTCGDTYQDFVDFCFKDGEVLAAASEVAVAQSLAPGMEASTGPRRTSAEPSAASMMATPVPRGPRRSLIRNEPASPTYGAPRSSPANREDDEAPDNRTPVPASGDDDDDGEPLMPQSLVETAPILRPQRKSAADNVTAPIPIPARGADQRTGELRAPSNAGAADAARSDGQTAEGNRAPAAAPQFRQLINTTPKEKTFVGEVVEPESPTMLLLGAMAALVGVLFIVGTGAFLLYVWVGGDEGEVVADAGQIAEPAPVVPVAPEPVAPIAVVPEPPVPAPEVVPANVQPEPAPVVPDPVAPAPAPVVPAPAPGRPDPQPAPQRPVPPRPAPPAPEVVAVQHLKFVSKPSGASVDVAGAVRQTPFELDLGPGTHRWSAQQKNRKPRESSVVIETPTADPLTVDVSLPAETRSCLLTSANDVVEVYVDGQTIMTLLTSELPVGVHNVTAKLSSGATARGVLEVPSLAVVPERCVTNVQVSTVSTPP